MICNLYVHTKNAAIKFQMDSKILFSYLCVVIYLIIPLCSASEVPFEDRIKVNSDKLIIGPRYKTQESSGSHSERHSTVDITCFHGIATTKCSDRESCLKWADVGRFQITSIDDQCENHQITLGVDKQQISVEFNISGLHLYGGSQRSYQSWPIEKIPMNDVAYVSHEDDSRAVLESYWLDSTGQYIYVDEKVPLFVSLNENVLKLSARKQAPYIRKGSTIYLEYIVCSFKNVKDAQQDAIKRVLGKPRENVDYKMVQLPIWTTWAKYKSNISQETVLSFANEISDHNMPNSQLEIDDKWETCYGSLTIDTKSFPNMAKLVKELKQKGYRVTIWVHPFINIDCEPYFSDAKKSNYFVRRENGSVNTVWWNGQGAYIDFTNEKAVEWYTTRLKNLLVETGIDAYKFDAGESSWSPQTSYFSIMNENHPETILKSYIATVSTFGKMVEVRSARGTQSYPVFLRMMDRETNWNKRLGLSTLIPTLLHFNIIGYPFVLPDMIGGNGYGDDIVTEELFIRWLQVNVFMPSLQFSYPPWQFSKQAIEITRKMIKLHADYAPLIYDLMSESTISGKPVNLPLWWLDPEDKTAQSIDSEFLLGENLLVAPVLEQGARTRDIYFPKGTWKDENHQDSDVITGPKWIHGYKADIDTLPFFTRVSSTNGAYLNLPRELLIVLTTAFLLLISSSSSSSLLLLSL